MFCRALASAPIGDLQQHAQARLASLWVVTLAQKLPRFGLDIGSRWPASGVSALSLLPCETIPRLKLVRRLAIVLRRALLPVRRSLFAAFWSLGFHAGRIFISACRAAHADARLEIQSAASPLRIWLWKPPAGLALVQPSACRAVRSPHAALPLRLAGFSPCGEHQSFAARPLPSESFCLSGREYL